MSNTTPKTTPQAGEPPREDETPQPWPYDSARAEIGSLRKQLHEWLDASAPGGWINDLREQAQARDEQIAVEQRKTRIALHHERQVSSGRPSVTRSAGENSTWLVRRRSNTNRYNRPRVTLIHEEGDAMSLPAHLIIKRLRVIADWLEVAKLIPSTAMTEYRCDQLMEACRAGADALERVDTDQQAAFEMACELKDLVEDLRARWDMDHRSTNPGIKHHVKRCEEAYTRYQQSSTGEKP